MGAPKQKWLAEEEEALRAGVEKHGAGKWRTIQKDPEFSHCLSSRSNIDLKVLFYFIFSIFFFCLDLMLAFVVSRKKKGERSMGSDVTCTSLGLTSTLPVRGEL